MENDADLFIEAKKLLKEQRCGDAKRLLELLANKEPDNLDYLLALAKAYFLDDDFEVATPVLEKIIKLKPDFELASGTLFLCYFIQKKMDMATDEMIRFISKYPILEYREVIKDLLSAKMPFQIKKISE